MTQLLPHRSEVDVGDRSSRIVRLDEAPADAVFSILSTRTARAMLVELYREPTTLSALADRTDISVQNATYHLDRLQESGLVEAVDTWYSSRGREMDVYAPTSDPLLLVAGDVDDDADTRGRTTDRVRP